MGKGLKKIPRIRGARIFAELIKDEMKSRSKRSFRERLFCLRKGFKSETVNHYGVKRKEDLQDYLSDYERNLAKYINGAFAPVLDNKILFERVLSSSFRVPKNYAVVDHGRLWDLREPVSFDQFSVYWEECQKDDCLVIKPIVGGFGEGIMIVRKQPSGYTVNHHEAITAEELDRRVAGLDRVLVSEFIRQHEYAAALYPHSTNTIRILMIRNPGTGQVMLVDAVQRIGSRFTKGLDNFSQGGIVAHVHVDSGVLSTGRYADERWRTHPVKEHWDTNARIEGVPIPGWEQIKADLKEKMQKQPFLRYAGWDVVVTEDGYAVIEGNNYPNPRIHQLFSPLLKNSQVLEFYRYYGIKK